ncbi:protein IQ-DOMAIN 1-like isoform X1 [Senna tora]|uniref:Protein IQ-DOMAIN 1-like isoform X1 n=1 Tax=Senna tora TaxID=362788 RepID=A0A834WGL1_9FABA|nr:protein IQ-DOMAIN 1-like isoform X1 [Senna tora]
MQTLARLQSQVRERRARMSEENQPLQQQKHEKEVEKLQAAQTLEKWDDSAQSKEQVEARLSKRLDASIRRERALAYAFSQQVPDYHLVYF